MPEKELIGKPSVIAAAPLSEPGKSFLPPPDSFKGLDITSANHVWCSDITCIPMAKGFCYLTAVMDLSKQKGFVLQAVEHARSLLLYRRAGRGDGTIRNT